MIIFYTCWVKQNSVQINFTLTCLSSISPELCWHHITIPQLFLLEHLSTPAWEQCHYQIPSFGPASETAGHSRDELKTPALILGVYDCPPFSEFFPGPLSLPVPIPFLFCCLGEGDLSHYHFNTEAIQLLGILTSFPGCSSTGPVFGQQFYLRAYNFLNSLCQERFTV